LALRGQLRGCPSGNWRLKMNRLEMLTKGKNIEPAKVAQEKLSAARALLAGKRGEHEALRRKRAEESSKNQANSRRLEYFDDQIVLIKREIDNLPFEIAAMEDRLMRSKIEDTAKQHLHDTFMEEISIKDIQKKSRLLSKQLNSALKTNEEILGFHRSRIEIEKNTGRRIAVPNICGGFNSLKILAEICEGENDGRSRELTRWSNWSSVIGDDTI